MHGGWITRVVARELLRGVLGVCAIALPRGSAAQAAPPAKPAVVHLFVSQTNGPALSDVELAIVRDGAQAILVGRSDSAGRYTFRVDVDSGRRYSIIARKIGFSPATSTVRLVAGDTLSVDVELAPAVTELPRVSVKGRETDHFLGASEIASSRRAIYNAFDAIRKLRPYMLGDPDRCPREPTDNVWVNGRRELFMASKIPDPGAPFPVRRNVRSATPRIAARKGGSAGLDSMLASIKSEHIDEIRWLDCKDHSLPGMGTNNAIYIVLKPGIGYNWNRGSFVDTAITRAPTRKHN